MYWRSIIKESFTFGIDFNKKNIIKFLNFVENMAIAINTTACKNLIKNQKTFSYF